MQEIAGHYDTGKAGQIDQARLQLAHSVLAVASDNGRDAEQLNRDALQTLALAYRPRSELASGQNAALRPGHDSTS